jgi:hypothetical protein
MYVILLFLLLFLSSIRSAFVRAALSALPRILIVEEFEERIAACLVTVEIVDVAEIGAGVADRKDLGLRARLDLATRSTAEGKVKVDKIGVLLITSEAGELPGSGKASGLGEQGVSAIVMGIEPLSGGLSVDSLQHFILDLLATVLEDNLDLAPSVYRGARLGASHGGSESDEEG